jgi:ubiquitin-protein ligase
MSANNRYQLSGKQMKKILKVLEKSQKADSENFIIIPDPLNPDNPDMTVVYFLAVGYDNAHRGGVYPGTLHLDFARIAKKRKCDPEQLSWPRDFAPGIQMLINTGFYQEGGRICTSVGEFHDGENASKANHSRGWIPALKMLGFLTNLFSMLAAYSETEKKDMPSGVSGISFHPESLESRRELAASSEARARESYPEVMAAFDAYAEANPTAKAVLAWRHGKPYDEITPEELEAGAPAAAAAAKLAEAEAVEAEAAQAEAIAAAASAAVRDAAVSLVEAAAGVVEAPAGGGEAPAGGGEAPPTYAESSSDGEGADPPPNYSEVDPASE